MIVKRVPIDVYCEKKIQTLQANYDGLIDYVDISSVDNNEKKIASYQTIESKDAPSRAKQLLKKGDILVSTVRPNLNAVAMVEEKTANLMVGSTGYCVLRCKDSANIRYLFNYCQSPYFVNDMTLQATGASYPAVSTTIVRNSLIPCYSSEEQREISKKFEIINELIADKRKQLNLLNEVIKSKFIEMFGDPTLNPYDWEVVNITDVVAGKVSNGFFAKRDEYTDDGNVRILGVANIVNRMYSNVENLPKTTSTTSDIQKFEVRYGDMLFCRSSLVAKGIGKASIVPHDVPPNTLFECHVIRLPLDLNKCVPEFMQALSTTYYFRTQIVSQSKTATMTTIGQDGILKTMIILPPIELQKQFLEFVKQTDKIKINIQNSLETLETLKKSLMQKYFG